MQYASPLLRRNNGRTLRLATLVFLAVFAFTIFGCSTVAPASDVPVGSSLDTSYQIEVVGAAPAEVTRDGFDAQFTFRVFALDELSQTCLVQELTQRAVYEFADGHEEVREFALVEAFKLRLADDGSVPRRYELAPGQRDRHFLTGLSDLRPEVTGVRIDRKVFAYVANVNNADFTKRGFAQLPRNERGDVVTTVGRGFNASYQRSHQTRGEVISTNRLGGLVYRMTYHLLRFGDGPAQFTVDRGGGFGRVVKPEILVLSR